MKGVTMCIQKIVLIVMATLTVGLIGCEPALMEGDVGLVAYNTPAEELSEPKVSIRCSRGPDGELVVDVAPNLRTRLITDVDFAVEGDERSRWDLHCEHLGVALLCYNMFGQIRHVVYGEVPKDTIQEYPEENSSPTPLPPEAVVHVKARYVYNVFPDGDVGTCCIWIQLVGDDEVKYLGESDYCRHFRSGENRFFVRPEEQAGGE
jgi:hypothetical protein